MNLCHLRGSVGDTIYAVLCCADFKNHLTIAHDRQEMHWLFWGSRNPPVWFYQQGFGLTVNFSGPTH
jgi:hypothetical protein